MARDELETRILDLEREVAALRDALRTFRSSPQDDTLGSKQRAFQTQFLRGNGHVSKITLNAAGTGLDVEKVQ